MNDQDSLKQLKTIKLQLVEILNEESQDVERIQRLVTRYRILIPASYEQLRSSLSVGEFAQLIQQEQEFLSIVNSTVTRKQNEAKSQLLKLRKGRKARNFY